MSIKGTFLDNRTGAAAIEDAYAKIFVTQVATDHLTARVCVYYSEAARHECKYTISQMSFELPFSTIEDLALYKIAYRELKKLRNDPSGPEDETNPVIFAGWVDA